MAASRQENAAHPEPVGQVVTDAPRQNPVPDRLPNLKSTGAARPNPVRPETGNVARGDGEHRRATRDTTVNVPSVVEVPFTQGMDPPEVPRPKHYKVRVNSLFVAHNEVFRPGVDYRVSEEIFNGEVDEKPFKDLCATVEEIQAR